MVNTRDSSEAAYVRELLDLAGFELQGGSRAPLLRLETGAINSYRDRADRLLTIDHAVPQSKAPGMATDPANLRFMTGRDNSFRGSRYDGSDQPYKGYPWRAQLPSVADLAAKAEQ